MLTNRNTQPRPHCVDLAPGTFNSSGHSRGQVSTGKRPSSASGSRARSQNTRSGAVRVRTDAAAVEPSPYLSTRTKLYTALAAVVGGIVWTTLESPASTPSPEPREVVRASMPAPTFFFDDAVDALSAHFSQENSDHQRPLDTVAGETVAMVSPQLDQRVAITRSAPDLPPATSSTTTQSARALAVDPLEPLLEPVDDIVTHTLSPLVDHPALTAEQTDAATSASMSSTVVVAVAPGNTLSGILNDHGVGIDEMPALLTNEQVKEHLSNLDVGQQMTIRQSADGGFEMLTARVGSDRRVTIERNNGQFTVSVQELPVERERVVTAGTIQQSLYHAAQQADLKQSTIMELADIFQWELDFARDIRKGDQFSLVYDRLYREGEYIGDGDIVAAEFIRGGKVHRAIRFTTEDGRTDYYSPDGQPKRRTFMRHPVDVVRITSKFNPNRMHPVLHKIRAHRGVDYGSPVGSPIYATADGKVIFSGMKSSYGNTVELQHGQRITTLYAHMSRIADKARSGARVKQGDVIGYVGATGRVTGAHLHYEFRVANMHVDPLKVELPAAPPIDQKYLPELQALSAEMSARMASARPVSDQPVASVSLPPVAAAASPASQSGLPTVLP